MTTRALRDSDIPKLEAMYRASGFAYDFPDLRGARMETVLVIADDADEPIMAAAAERLIQLYLFAPKMAPGATLRAVRLLHAGMRERLQGMYSEANAFLPPSIDERFGRWLVRRFGWVQSWKAWGVRI